MRVHSSDWFQPTYGIFISTWANLEVLRNSSAWGLLSVRIVTSLDPAPSGAIPTDIIMTCHCVNHLEDITLLSGTGPAQSRIATYSEARHTGDDTLAKAMPKENILTYQRAYHVGDIALLLGTCPLE